MIAYLLLWNRDAALESRKGWLTKSIRKCIHFFTYFLQMQRKSIFLNLASQDTGYFIFVTTWVMLSPSSEWTLVKKSGSPAQAYPIPARQSTIIIIFLLVSVGNE